MNTITRELPEDVFSALRRSPEELGDELRVAAAIQWYRRGEPSQENAALIACLDRTDFLMAHARQLHCAFIISTTSSTSWSVAEPPASDAYPWAK